MLIHPVYQKLLKQKEVTKNCLCIGLDPDVSKLPTYYPKTTEGTLSFLLDIINNTHTLCIAYKPNISFFEAMGLEGLKMLQTVCLNIPDKNAIIMDAKRGDIGNTSRMQAAFIFNNFKTDAITVNPLMGYDSVEPFLAYSDKLVFLLGLTSNPGSNDFERLPLNSGKTVYEQIIETSEQWNSQHQNIGLVIGATHSELPIIRTKSSLPFLIPGVGAQGGTYKHALVGADKNGLCLINIGRQILYGSDEKITPSIITKRIETILDNPN